MYRKLVIEHATIQRADTQQSKSSSTATRKPSSDKSSKVVQTSYLSCNVHQVIENYRSLKYTRIAIQALTYYITIT